MIYLLAYFVCITFIYFFLQESNDLVRSDPLITEKISEDDTSGQSSEAISNATAVGKSLVFFFIIMEMFICLLYLDESILSNNSNPNVPCTPPSLAPGVTPSSIDTTSPDTFQKKEETQRVTTTDIQPNSVQRKFDYRRYNY
jgi:hypothetical protein